jgi:hypothetical protein
MVTAAATATATTAATGVVVVGFAGSKTKYDCRQKQGNPEKRCVSRYSSRNAPHLKNVLHKELLGFP